MIGYGTKTETGYQDIFSNPRQTLMCLGREPTDILKLDIQETPDGPYWGWQNTGETKFCMIFSRELLLETCFPYGTKAEIERGKGRVVRLSVTELGVEIKNATY